MAGLKPISNLKFLFKIQPLHWMQLVQEALLVIQEEIVDSKNEQCKAVATAVLVQIRDVQYFENKVISELIRKRTN